MADLETSTHTHSDPPTPSLSLIPVKKKKKRKEEKPCLFQSDPSPAQTVAWDKLCRWSSHKSPILQWILRALKHICYRGRGGSSRRNNRGRLCQTRTFRLWPRWERVAGVDHDGTEVIFTYSKVNGVRMRRSPSIHPCSASRAAFHLCRVTQCMHATTLEQGVLTIYWVFVV